MDNSDGQTAPVVKSAGRVLEILAFFDDERRPADLSEIVSRLGYPRSSCSALLHSLVELGYLAYDRSQRTYAPTARIALLGYRTDPRLVQPGRLMGALADIAAATGQSVVLAERRDRHAQVVHVVPASRLTVALPDPGALVPLSTAGLGHAVLAGMAGMAGPALTKLSNHLHKGAPLAQRKAAQAALRKAVAAVTDQGYAVAAAGEGAGVIAVPLPVDYGAPLALGLWGPASAIIAGRPRYLAAIREALAHHGLTSSTTPAPLCALARRQRPSPAPVGLAHAS